MNAAYRLFIPHSLFLCKKIFLPGIHSLFLPVPASEAPVAGFGGGLYVSGDEVLSSTSGRSRPQFGVGQDLSAKQMECQF